MTADMRSIVTVISIGTAVIISGVAVDQVHTANMRAVHAEAEADRADEYVSQLEQQYDDAVDANRNNGGCEVGPIDDPLIIPCDEASEWADTDLSPRTIDA